MSETPDKAHELIDKYLNDIATEEEVAQLGGMLVESRDAARAFAKASRQDGYLRDHFEERRTAQAADAAGQRAAAAKKEQAVRVQAPAFPVWGRAIAAAAAVLLVIGGVWWGVRNAARFAQEATQAKERGTRNAEGPWRGLRAGATRTGEPRALMARVTQLKRGSGWKTVDGTRTPLRVGDEVCPGVRLETAEDGCVEFVYELEQTAVELGENSKYELRMPGADMADMTNPKLACLEAGRLTARVAPQGKTNLFLVVTPHAEARVMGTALEMVVGPKSSALDVITGGVRYTRLSDGKTLEVRRGQGATAGDGMDFVLRTCRYFPGGDYSDGAILFQDDLMAGLDNWDVLVSTNRISFRKATEEEKADIVRKIEPDERWRNPEDTRGTVLRVEGYEAVALRLRKPMPATPISVEYVRQAEAGSSLDVLFGDVTEAEMTRKFTDARFEQGASLTIRREMIPLEIQGDRRIVEERDFVRETPWYIHRIIMLRRDEITVTLTLSGARRKALYTNVVIREMNKNQPAP